MSGGRDPEALADLLGGECPRTILVEGREAPRSAAELSDRAEVSEPTVYRRLERLREHDPVTEEIQPVTDGKNYGLYRTELDGIELDPGEDGFEITVPCRERMVDRFTRFVGNADMLDILPRIDLETLRTVRRASEVVPTIIGLAISYLAHAAYRRNRSRPMLYVAIGLVLALFVQAPPALILIHVLDLPAPVLNGLVRMPEFTGPGLILYGLWVPRRG